MTLPDFFISLLISLGRVEFGKRPKCFLQFHRIQDKRVSIALIISNQSINCYLYLGCTLIFPHEDISLPIEIHNET